VHEPNAHTSGGSQFELNGNSPQKQRLPLSSRSSGNGQPGPGKIPIDSAGARVDLALPTVLQKDFYDYLTRVSKGKLCNDHFLSDGCNRDDCMYDHGEVAANVVTVLRSVVRPKLKCPKRDACRAKACYRNHSKDMVQVNGASNEQVMWVEADE
jgi:hypothetical protein